MDFTSDHAGRDQEICDLFTATFTASEGPEEGKIIGSLVNDLLGTTAPDDLFVFLAVDQEVLAGTIVFSRLRFEQDARRVFILSPVAVRTDRQRQGIGQRLIAFGLAHLRRDGVDFAVTYGDPNYYAKTGFHQMSQGFAPAPLDLNHPHGWLGQPLKGRFEEARPFAGPSRCVAALNRPELW